MNEPWEFQSDSDDGQDLTSDIERGTCDALLLTEEGRFCRCDEDIMWRTPPSNPLYPMSYCAAHIPSALFGTNDK